MVYILCVCGFQDERYDGRDILPSTSRIPARTNFEVRPATDGFLFPSSRYPKHLSGGSNTSIMLVDASILLRPEYVMFYAGTTPTQFGQRFATVFHSQVVAVKKESPEQEFAQREFKPLDKFENNIVRLTMDDSTVYIATQVVVGGQSFPHAVFVSFFGGLDVPHDVRFAAKPGTKYAFTNSKVPCPDSGCDVACASLSELKVHYGRKHIDESLWQFSCKTCDKMFASKAALVAHERNHFKLYRCSKCAKAFGQKVTLIRHLYFEHRNERRYDDIDDPSLIATVT